jgi:coenzyme F420-0:L-glutamate ligase/coenzyme F420-1:gamma-L-glutamate ligase
MSYFNVKILTVKLHINKLKEVNMPTITLHSITKIPLVRKGDQVAQLIVESASSDGVMIEDGDLIVLAQKIVSKAEGATVKLSDVVASAKATELAQMTGRDARLCQLYLDEASEVIAVKGRMVITRHKLGYVGSSSGIDRSNIAPHSEEVMVLLPKDPDASARKIREDIKHLTGKTVAIIINDSCGRDYRDGSVGMAIGVGGIDALRIDEKVDLYGNPSTSRIAVVDEVAAAASLLMGQANEGVPVVVVKGVTYTVSENATIQDFIQK